MGWWSALTLTLCRFYICLGLETQAYWSEGGWSPVSDDGTIMFHPFKWFLPEATHIWYDGGHCAWLLGPFAVTKDRFGCEECWRDRREWLVDV